MNTDAEYMAAQVERLRRLFAPLRGLSEDTERLEKIVLACDRLTEVGVSKLPERLYSMTDPDQGLDVLLEIGVVNNILQVHPESTVDYEPEGKGPQPPDFKVAFSDRPIFLEVKRIRQLSLEAIREKLRRACREQLSGEPARFLNMLWMANETEGRDVQSFIEWLADHHRAHEDGREYLWPDPERPLIKFSLTPRRGYRRGIAVGLEMFGTNASGLLTPLDQEGIKRKLRSYLRDAEAKFRHLPEDAIPVLLIHPGGADFMRADLAAEALYGQAHPLAQRMTDGSVRHTWKRGDDGLFADGTELRTVGVALLSEKHFPFGTDFDGTFSPNPARDAAATYALRLMPGLKVLRISDAVG